ncbi:hypothetical protein OEA41_009278 [Lepraria neglecta]|uniref:MFS general substrate transporter n=1 Tax=Lepraria neglecta TaxID=209136 RepID=A0AAD9Z1N3_9LECA|nr:hypothetical protein OEA41_009278 [Lepraria neglecta]
MWHPDYQQYAVTYIVLSSVSISVLGSVIRGFIEKNFSWHWAFWVQLLFGGATQLIHFIVVPETRTTIMLDKKAKRRREADPNANVWGPNEIHTPRISMKEVLTLWHRPFEMFFCEPIVLCLSLLSGFSDALIFNFLEAYTPVYKQWGFDVVTTGLAFTPHRADPDSLQPEARLWWLLWTVPLLSVGLFGFSWTSLGPSYGMPWIAPMIFSVLVGIANYAIYMATIDYMIASYSPYPASATGGNSMSRDLLAGIAAMYSIPFYELVPGKYKLAIPTTVLGCIDILVTIPIYLFYWYGPTIRAKSKFAQVLAADRNAGGGTRWLSTASHGSQRGRVYPEKVFGTAKDHYRRKVGKADGNGLGVKLYDVPH